MFDDKAINEYKDDDVKTLWVLWQMREYSRFSRLFQMSRGRKQFIIIRQWGVQEVLFSGGERGRGRLRVEGSTEHLMI